MARRGVLARSQELVFNCHGGPLSRVGTPCPGCPLGRFGPQCRVPPTKSSSAGGAPTVGGGCRTRNQALAPLTIGGATVSGCRMRRRRVQVLDFTGGRVFSGGVARCRTHRHGSCSADRWAPVVRVQVSCHHSLRRRGACRIRAGLPAVQGVCRSRPLCNSRATSSTCKWRADPPPVPPLQVSGQGGAPVSVPNPKTFWVRQFGPIICPRSRPMRAAKRANDVPGPESNAAGRCALHQGIHLPRAYRNEMGS